MLRNFIVMIVAVLMLTSMVSADSFVTTSDIELPYRISHDGNRFVVDVGQDPGGNDNRIRVTTDGSTGTITVREDLNESLYCTSSNTVMGQYQQMMDVCRASILNQGNTSQLMNEARDLEVKKTEFESLWTVERNRREELEQTVSNLTGELEEMTSERDSYKRTADTVSARTDALRECEEELEDSENSQTNNLIIGGLLGAAGSYFMWGRKRDPYASDLPPEQEEAEEYGY